MVQGCSACSAPPLQAAEPWSPTGAGLTGAARGRAGGPGAEAPEELCLLDLILTVGRALDGVLVPHSWVGLLKQQLWGDNGWSGTWLVRSSQGLPLHPRGFSGDNNLSSTAIRM